MSNDKGTLIQIDKPWIAAFEDTPLRDPRLSWRAKGIIAYLLSKPPGWQIWTGDLVQRSTDGKAAVFAGLKELETLGYLKRERVNGTNGRIQWRKALSATPETPWTEASDLTTDEITSPSTDLPYMDNQDMVSPCTDLPYMVQPSMVNRTHSITHISISQLREEERETATPSEEEQAATPFEKGEEEEPPTATPVTAPTAETQPVTVTAPATAERAPVGLDIVRRVCVSCNVKVSPETVYGYAPVNLIVAEAARWWDETPAHKRAQNAGLLVYRIKTREYAPLTQEEIVRCHPYTSWLRGDDDADEPSQPELPIQEHPTQAKPRDAWTQFVQDFTTQNDGSQLAYWLAECASQWDGDTLTLIPRTPHYTTWVERQMQRSIERSLTIQVGRPITIQFTPSQIAA